MRVVIAGGHGKIAKLLLSRLAEHGVECLGLVRNPDHTAELRALGAESAVLDLETAALPAVAGIAEGADALVFAAGAGPGSGAARKDTVDRAAAVLFAEAAQTAGVRRFVQLSAMGLDRAYQPGVDDVFSAYLRAKEAAERDLRERDGLEWTILRPGRLTDEPATGSVALAEPGVLEAGSGSVSRADVALVLAALLESGAAAGKTVELLAGETPVDEAVAAL
ncbi:NAD(P)H-binding protein [Sciscionella sediminilitoris]|uniref:NAD(P)H-binding protein n=1 Tax=Sciscionella sediminilitoris TaxID=1445613 RepID=UPI0004DFB15D|nr:NAD(P)H-binding protein [Sciscionella sp. SE31]